jgi:hypothetical protein
MKKIILIIIVVLLLCGAGGAGYYFFVYKATPKSTYTPKDLTGLIVLPVEIPLQGKTFSVPDMEGVSTTLTFVSSTPKRDYPMGRFTSPDGVVEGTLVAQDDFVSDLINGRRAVPIVVSQGGSGEFYYLAILEDDGTTMRHIASVPLGDRIRVTEITNNGTQVTLTYLVYDRGQAFAETPRVVTSAIVDIASGALIQAGRNPLAESILGDKIFRGVYVWQETVTGDTTVRPEKPDAFMLTFDANALRLDTDCNSASAPYKALFGSSTEMTVETLAKTSKFCESNQEGIYFDMIQSITSYTETGTAITFTLKDDSTMTFMVKGKELEFASTTNETTVEEVIDAGE